MEEMLIDKIRRKISDGEIKEAIKLLQNGSEGFEDELALHLMQLSLLEKNNRLSVITYETYKSQLTKTSLSILDLAKLIDGKGKLNPKIEVSYLPSQEVKLYDSLLEEKWANFFRKIGWEFLVQKRISKNQIADFIIKGVNHTEIEVEVKSIETIDDLKDKSRFIRPEIPNTFLSNCIVLGNHPFVSKDGFYQDEEVVQIGWVFNYDGNFWDNIMLKGNFDISNSKYAIFNLINNKSSYKDFMDSSNFDRIMEIWNEK